jgi:acetyltransferase-like isoleucine patch superfamily enzyme
MKNRIPGLINNKKTFSYYLNLIRNLIISKEFEHLDLSCMIAKNAEILGKRNISIGANTIIHNHSVIQCTEWDKTEPSRGVIKIGNNCSIQPFAYLHSLGGKIIIGNYCSINPFTILYGGGGLVIGDHVRIAAHTVIIPANKKFQRIDLPIHEQGKITLGIQIDDDVWIGAGVKILDGVHIEKGCVIGAGSVVTHSTDAYGIYVGIPARKIKSRL